MISEVATSTLGIRQSYSELAGTGDQFSHYFRQIETTIIYFFLTQRMHVYPGDVIDRDAASQQDVWVNVMFDLI